MSQPKPQSGGFKTFSIVWLGQVISLFGSALTSFALGIWVYQETGSVTKFALISFFTTLPTTLLSPALGALIDRADRRHAMILGDILSGLCTFAIFFLLWNHRLEIWHIYILVAISAIGNTGQILAFNASTALLVPKSQLGRASGMTQSGGAAAEIAAPLVAAFLMAMIALEWIVLFDFMTFVIAILSLLIVRIPRPQDMEGQREERGEKALITQEIRSAWRYLNERPGFMGLMFMMAVINLTRAAAMVLITPLVLGFSSVKALGSVLASAGFGMLAGGVLMGIWGGPRRRVNGIYGGLLMYAVMFCLAGVVTTYGAMIVVAFLLLVPGPIINGCSQAIWQSKVALGLQGRIFAFRRMVTFATVPVAHLLSGPLTDYVFEPLLATDGLLAGTVGRVVGVGTGRGIGFFFILMGILMILTLVWILQYRHIRLIEDELPDAIAEQGST